MINYKIAWRFRVPWLRVSVVIFYIIFLLGFLKITQINFWRKKSELSICTFADLISMDIVEAFQKQTGIYVSVKYCELDSELLTQISMGSGNIDLITPANFIAKRLYDLRLLRLIETANGKLMNCDLHPKFIKDSLQGFSQYVVPFAWNYYAIGYRKSFFDKTSIVPDSLESIFNPMKFFQNNQQIMKDYKVALYEDNPIEMLTTASQYLFGQGDVDWSDQAHQQSLIDLFVQLKKKWFYGFIYSNITYYLSFVVPVVLTFASLLKELIAEHKDDFGIKVPKEGTMMILQNFCIPLKAENVDAAYKFINFCMTEEISSKIFKDQGYLPVRRKVIDDLRSLETFGNSLIPTEEEMDRVVCVDKLMTITQAESMWLSIKCAS